MAKKEKILVLDDDPAVTLSCQRILGVEGYSITTVARGEDAIKRVSSEEFDLLISDVRLPDISGITVLKETKLIQPKMDVAIITGYPTLEDARESVRLGAFEFLEKPFTPEFMLNMARRVFDERGWILRKAFIDEFRNSIVDLRDQDNPVLFYKEGTWARPLKGGMWEVGCDLRYLLLEGQMVYVELTDKLPALVAGESFGQVVLGDGRSHELLAPMTGRVRELNMGANNAVSELVRDNLAQGWLLWLARIAPIEGARL
ncbi:MAG: response regulator [Nitrospirae bacterium]|nr:response regulator [Nitrospirota bacterium]